MVPSEEAKVQGLVARTTEVLRQASAGKDDIGSRYSRLLELLWKTKSSTSTETPHSNDFAMQTALSNPVTDHTYMDFSPAWRFVGRHTHWTDSVVNLANAYLRRIFEVEDPNGDVPPVSRLTDSRPSVFFFCCITHNRHFLLVHFHPRSPH